MCSDCEAKTKTEHQNLSIADPDFRIRDELYLSHQRLLPENMLVISLKEPDVSDGKWKWRIGL